MGRSIEFRSAGIGWLFGAARKLRFDAEGLDYRGPDQELSLKWRDIHALVAAAVLLPANEHPIQVPALGICLRRPFLHPTLVDGVLPNLDYAIPISDLGRMPLVLNMLPTEIFERAAEFSRGAGVSIVTDQRMSTAGGCRLSQPNPDYPAQRRTPSK